ncbi:MAG TPA: NAD(P)-dependent alcohol dehydrogenase [Verrucomicrobiae bacterium]|nr:NAD(P)-dependent alcohol dehydrogenase [Verrucomicrobiae bacterium]
MNITAAVTRAPRSPMSLEALELEPPRDDEILVRVVATGICHTDIAMRDQAYPVPQPVVLGHEGAGVVVMAGSAITSVAPGDHVVMSYNSCGACPSCVAGAATYCYDFFGRNFAAVRADGTTPITNSDGTIHGNFFGQSSFADFALCNERNVVKVSKDVPLELLGPLACGVQTGAGAVLNALRIARGRSFAVFGAGSVGLSAVMAAAVAGASPVIAVDPVESRLALARELGATHTVNPLNGNPSEEIVRLTGAGADFALEATGISTVIRQAVESLAPRGVCGILGAAPAGSEMTLDVLHLMTAGRTLRGIVEGDANPKAFIPMLIDLYRDGRFPFDKLIRYYPFERVNEAIEDAESGRVVKAVVRMRHGT